MLLTVALASNLIAGLASSFVAQIAIRNSQRLSKSLAVNDGERFYCAMYAARSISFGVVAGLLPLFTTGRAVIAVVVWRRTSNYST